MMKKTKTKTATIAIATALTTLLSAGAAFADTSSSNAVQTSEFSQTQCTESHSWFKSHLDSLVTSGTLNEAQESAIQNMISKVDSAKGGFDKGNHYGQFKTVLNDLVKAGTITQAQEDAILSGTKLTATPAVEAVPAAVEASAAVEAVPAVVASPAVRASHVDIKTVMDGLVKERVITQAQEDAIQAQLNQQRVHQQ